MRLMPYADDTIWLLFGLGVAMVAGVVLFYLLLGEFDWASVGFLITGLLVMVSYYVIGTHPPTSTGVGQGVT